MLTSTVGSALLAALIHGAAVSTAVREQLLGDDSLDRVAIALADDVSPLATGLQSRAMALPTSPELAAEALDLWVPLADAIGLRSEQVLLEDASFRALHPAAYAALADHDRPLAPALESLATELGTVLSTERIDAHTQGRVKSLYSTWRKMERKGLDIHEVHDRIALRVITADEADARQVLAALHRRYEPVEGAFDDYIAAPKANGYQSLHTAVRTPFGIAEYQVRTEAMHAAAESGDQAHWRYKRHSA